MSDLNVLDSYWVDTLACGDRLVFHEDGEQRHVGPVMEGAHLSDFVRVALRHSRLLAGVRGELGRREMVGQLSMFEGSSALE